MKIIGGEKERPSHNFPLNLSSLQAYYTCSWKMTYFEMILLVSCPFYSVLSTRLFSCYLDVFSVRLFSFSLNVLSVRLLSCHLDVFSMRLFSDCLGALSIFAKIYNDFTLRITLFWLMSSTNVLFSANSVFDFKLFWEDE